MNPARATDNTEADPVRDPGIVVRGDLHLHTTWSDGRDTVERMARACLSRGYAYLAITDHSRSLRVARGLSPERLRMQWAEIDRVRARVPEIRILRGLEVDILPSGGLDLPDDMLEALDLVIISVHSRLDMPRARFTDRVIRAMSHPATDILGHPTGRMIGRRKPSDLDLDAVLRAAAELDVAVEINAQPHRLDLDADNARRAREIGVRLAIDTDAHAVGALDYMAAGLRLAADAGLASTDVLNASTLPALEAWLARDRSLPDTT
ncbi:MAG: PHP domain-containing protein [Gemmatimonadota bacterium]|jgi:DNA polymerase (family 10)